MTLDDRIAHHNADIFFREFTYSATNFKGIDGQERELCDGAVWIGDLLILLQNKERDANADTGDSEAETRWFNKKVSKLAVDQICDSLRYLRDEQSLPLANMRGQTLDLKQSQDKVTQTHLVVLFSPSEALPSDLLLKKGRRSQRAGEFVHFMTANDYYRVSVTLHTPFEVSDYLSFRKNISIANFEANSISEKALLGQYLLDPDPNQPVSVNFEGYVDRLIQNQEDFSLSNILRVYLDRATLGVEGTNYHLILIELAKLRRHMAEEFRKKFVWAMEACKGTSNLKPTRFYFPTLDCSYIFIPLESSQRDEWEKHLMPMTCLSKHDLRCQKSIGISVATDPTDSKYFLVHWYYVDFPWQPDEKADQLIREISPFRKTTELRKPVYHFQPN